MQITTEVRDELRKIQGRKALITPEAVVEFARDPRTALHSQFDWDDRRAAHKHRLWQAREILRMAVVMLDPGAGRDQEVRMTVSLANDRGSGYRSTQQVLDDPSSREDLVHELLNRIDSILNSYKLPELKPVADAVAKVRRSRNLKAA